MPQHFRRVRRRRANNANWPSASRSPALAGAGHSAEPALQGGQTGSQRGAPSCPNNSSPARFHLGTGFLGRLRAVSLLMCRHDGAPTASPDQSRRALFPRHSPSGNRHPPFVIRAGVSPGRCWPRHDHVFCGFLAHQGSLSPAEVSWTLSPSRFSEQDFSILNSRLLSLSVPQMTRCRTSKSCLMFFALKFRNAQWGSQ